MKKSKKSKKGAEITLNELAPDYIKVTRRVPDYGTQDTKVFKKLGKALDKFDEWTDDY